MAMRWAGRASSSFSPRRGPTDLRLRSEVLIREHVFFRLLDDDERTLCGLVAGVAGFRQFDIGSGKFGFVFRVDGLAEVVNGLPDHGFDQLDDTHPLPLGPLN